MKKSNKRGIWLILAILSALVATLMLVSSLTYAAVPVAKKIADVATHTVTATSGSDETYEEVGKFLRANWSDEYFVSIELTGGSSSYAVNEEPGAAKSRKRTLVGKFSALIPTEVLAQVTDAFDGDLPEGDYISPATAEKMGLEVKVDNSEGKVTITSPFQTKRLLVMTDGRDLTEYFGAVQVLKLPYNNVALQYDSVLAAEAAYEKLKDAPEVAICCPDDVMSPQALAQPQAQPQAQAQHLSWGPGRVKTDEYQAYLKKVSPNLPEVRVAVVDTGMTMDHPHFKGRLADKWYNVIGGYVQNGPMEDPYKFGHGTHVSGIVVDNSPSNVKIVPVRAGDDRGLIPLMNAQYGIYWASDKTKGNADVINLSLGSYDEGELGKTKTELWRAVIKHAIDRNVVVVTAAGNDGEDAKYFFPANAGVENIAVGNHRSDNGHKGNWGETVDVCAPGTDIRSSINTGDYGNDTGTSMASPVVAAEAAMLKSLNKSYTPAYIRAQIMAATYGTGYPNCVPQYGHGLVNFAKLIPPPAYSVRFNANGGTGAMTDQTLTVGKAEELKANEFTNTGYAFAGWAATSTGAVAYTDSQSVQDLATTENAVVDIYAVWTANKYTVKYDANGGTGTMADQEFAIGAPQVLHTNAFTRTGYKFAGWSYTPTGSAELTDGHLVANLSTIDGAIVNLHAVWAPNLYRVEFNANGGTGHMDAQDFVFDVPQALMLNAFVWNDHHFMGWATSQNGEVAHTDGHTVSNLSETDGATVSLFAIWKMLAKPIEPPIAPPTPPVEPPAPPVEPPAPPTPTPPGITPPTPPMPTPPGITTPPAVTTPTPPGVTTPTKPGITPPVEPPKPTEPTKPVEPPKPTEPTKPVEPPKPTEPTKPVEPPKPTEPTKPVEPPKPTEPTKPVEPPKPTEPTKPVEPPKPTEPTKPPYQGDVVAPVVFETSPTAIILKYVKGYEYTKDGRNSNAVFQDSNVFHGLSPGTTYYMAQRVKATAAMSASPMSGVVGATTGKMGGLKPTPVEPPKPTEPTKPVAPPKPTEPTKPVEPTKPTEPTKPVEPAKPPQVVGKNPGNNSNPGSGTGVIPGKPQAPSATMPKTPGTDASKLPATKPAESSKQTAGSNASTAGASGTGNGSFADVGKGAWYYDDVKYAAENGIFKGTSDGTFSPDATMSRAMLITALWRMSGGAKPGARNPFGDVKAGDWYADAVVWAKAGGIVEGFGGLFQPDAPVSRQDLATILARYVKATKMQLTDAVADREFSDWNNTASYAKDAVNRLTAWGLIGGKPGNLFDPSGETTRAEAAAIMHRLATAEQIK